MTGVLHAFFQFIGLVVVLCSLVTGKEENITGERTTNLLLTDKNWDQMLHGEWMLKFYAPWCPACRAMEETWNDFAEWAINNKEKEVKVGSVDVTDQPALNGRFMITALPTIYHVIDGEFRQYTSSRALEDFKGFISKEEWKDLTPVSSWNSPTSFIMSTMSKLFSFSMDLKSYHNSLNSDYGFPTWLSMLLFGLLIITVGLLLGMVLVLATDYIWASPQYITGNDIINKKDDDNVRTEKDSNGGLVEENVNEGLEKESETDKCETVNGTSNESTDEIQGSNVEEATELRQRKVKTDEVEE